MLTILCALLAAVAGACELDPAQVQELARTVEAGFAKSEPFYADYGPTPLFHNHIDYHSSVHAHWAMLSMARALGDATLLKRERARLPLASVKKELDYLSQNSVELPYGRAWFLLLLNEMEAQGITDAGLRQRRERLETELVAWLDEDRDHSETSGTYDSWMMTYFLMSQSAKDRPALQASLAALVDRIPSGAIPRQSGDFVSVEALRAVLDGTQALPLLPDYSQAPSEDHEAGYWVSLLWPMAKRTNSGEVSCETLQVNFAAAFENRDLWENNYLGRSHWVPQYLWMALYLAK